MYTIGTQISNIYLNQLQWYGQFAEVFMLPEVLSLEIYSDISVTKSFPSVPCRDWPAAIDHRSVVPTVAARSLCPDRRPPDTASPYNILVRTPSIPRHAKFWRCSVIFRYQYLKVYRNSINTKSWVKDVIQGFAQKAVKLNTKMS